MQAERQTGERVGLLEHAIREAVPDWSHPTLIAMCGIDVIAAVTILAEIGYLARFRSPRQLMACLGLIPSAHSAGESVKRGGITKAGNGRARRVPVEAAWADRHPPRVGVKRQASARRRSPACRPRDRMKGAGPALQDRTQKHAMALSCYCFASLITKSAHCCIMSMRSARKRVRL